MNRTVEPQALARQRVSRIAVMLLSVLSLAACGGGGDNSASGGGDGGGSGGNGAPPPANVAIHASVAGLIGQGLILQNNASGDLSVAANGQFTFSNPVAAGSAYAVTVKTQPTAPNQLCTVNGGTGTASETGVNTATVTCSTTSVNIRGTASGISGIGMVLQNNGADDLVVNGNGSFVFSTPVARGAGYTVTLKTPPAFPLQQCTVGAASGTAADTDVSDVTVNCTTQTSRFAYVANVSSSDISTFTADATTGALVSTGSVTTPFPSPYIVAVDPLRRFLYVGNSNSASGGGVAVYQINASSGGLTQAAGSPYTTNTSVQAVVPHPSGDFVYALNLSGSVSAYAVDGTTGGLTAVPGSPFAAGVSPRGMVIDPIGKHAYVSDSGSARIFVYDIGANGALTQIAGSPFTVNNTYTIAMSRDGKFLYVNLMGQNKIAVYAVDAATGTLTLASEAPAGSGGRGIAVHPTGRYLYVSNQADNNVTAYQLDPTTGALSPITTVAAGTQPIGLALDATGSFLYVANSSTGDITVYQLDRLTGAPVVVGGAAPTAPNPFNLAFY